MNVSGGTAVMRDKEGYRGIPKAYIQGWGQGLALSFFATLLISDDIEKDGALQMFRRNFLFGKDGGTANLIDVGSEDLYQPVTVL